MTNRCDGEKVNSGKDNPQSLDNWSQLGQAQYAKCSCLENPRDGGAWWAAVYGFAQSQTRLKQLSSSSSSSNMQNLAEYLLGQKRIMSSVWDISKYLRCLKYQ